MASHPQRRGQTATTAPPPAAIAAAGAVAETTTTTRTVRKFYLSNKVQHKMAASSLSPTPDLFPPKFTANRQYIPPTQHHRDSRHPEYDTDNSLADSTRRYDADTDSSNESDRNSTSASPYTSVAPTPIDSSDLGQLPISSHDFFRPKGVLPPQPGRAVIRRRSDDSIESVTPATGNAVTVGSSTGELARRRESAAHEHQGVEHERKKKSVNVDDGDVEEGGPRGEIELKASPVQRVTVKDQNRGRRNITIQKYVVTAGLIAVNTFMIFSSWWWSRYYYLLLPFICFPLVLNCCMIASIIFFKIRNTIRPERIIQPDHVEALAMIMPCYNETFEECTKSLDSLVSQVGIDENKKAILVVCDGRVRGPGMEKTTADYLLEDIFVDATHREKIPSAYTGWNGELMDLEISKGFYKGVPFYCMVKEKNQGKRDSLIVVRSFLHKYNVRRTGPKHIFSSRFFNSLTNWLSQEVQADFIDHLIGMDADTVFDTDCIEQLLKESRYPNTVGVCGFVAVDFSGGNWNVWSLYQNAEYSIAQALRRLHQSIATKKVSCLPGCCQLLKICETTCGDKVLIDLFGYHPTPLDGMLKQIRATASEDRNHVCLMLTTFPEAQTRQALRARAFTDVPHSWSVYLSQRRRWTLGATSNDLLLFMARNCQWWERILAFSNVLCWCLNVFIVASIGCMIVAFMTQPWWIIMAFAGVMLIPLTYYLVVTTWLPTTMLGRFQYLAGLAVFVVCGPFLNIIVMIFAVINMDSFGWGKTRMVVEDDEDSSMEKKTAAVGGQIESSSGTSVDAGVQQQQQGQGQGEKAGVIGKPQAAHL